VESSPRITLPKSIIGYSTFAIAFLLVHKIWI